MPAVLHVATAGSDSSEGSPDRPLRTIDRAAELAQPGDPGALVKPTARLKWRN